MQTIQCLFCKEKENLKTVYEQNFSEELLNPVVFSARRTADHIHYNVVRCRNCSLLFSTPVLEQEKLSVLYTGSTETYSEETVNIVSSYLNPLKGFFHLIRKESALEIGCGSGFFLRALLENGFRKVTGFEPSAHAVSTAHSSVRDSLRRIMFEDAGIPEESYDLICSFQTFDHMRDPLSALRKCFRILKKGGLLYLVVHNEQAVQAKILREWSPIIDIQHIYLFNRKTLRLLIETGNFRILSLFNLRNTYSLAYWIRMTPLPFKKIVQGLIAPVRHKKISLQAGNIAIIAQKP